MEKHATFFPRIFMLLFFLLAFMPYACSDKDDTPPIEEIDETKPYLTVPDANIKMGRMPDTRRIKFKTNITLDDVSVSVPQASQEWCKVEKSHSDTTLIITTLITNNQSSERSTTVLLKGGDIRRNIYISQMGRNGATGEVAGDISIPVTSASASSFQSGEGIEKSHDGNISTIYHSKYSDQANQAPGYFPITLTYNFKDVATMDYLVYNPRSDGGVNGNFKELDLYIATENNPSLTQYGSYDFKGSTSPSLITFSPALEKVTKIEFKVKSGTGNYASCAEMQFYKKNPDNFDYTTLFTDETCSELKAGITIDKIEKVENPFFKDLALEIYKGEYDKEFRVQEYKAWQHPDIMAASNKTSSYSLLDNPTGIYTSDGENLIVFVGDTHNQSISLRIQDLRNGYGGQSYPLMTGINKISSVKRGLIYIMYHTATGKEKPIKINIATGGINGYFDAQKHTKEDWVRLLNKADYGEFDVLGEYAHLTFPTANFRANTPDGAALIKKYDELVYLEQKFMGLFEYGRKFNNRMYFHVDYGDVHMYATAYHTGYALATINGLCNVNTFTADVWGPAHEVGHVNQTRPGLKWLGMTEVTNNIHSLYIQTTFGNRSRLIKENLYAKAKKEIIDGKIAHNASNDFFTRLVPFWQLKLYFHDVLKNDKFYMQIYEKIRVNPDPPTDGDCQMEFIKLICDTGKLDLTEFFEAWGFCTPINKEINDYEIKRFIVTQSMIDDCKAYIAGKGYPKPAHKIQDITDENISSFK